MPLRRYAMLAAAFLLLALSPSAGQALSDQFTLNLGEAGSLSMTLPPGWAGEVASPDGAMPPTVAISQEGSERFVLLVTPIWAGPEAPPDFGTPGSLRRIVESSAAEIAPGAVEDKLTIEPVGGGKSGFMFSATDSSLVGRTPPPGEYLYLTQGALMVGKLLCTFTILTNERPSPDSEQALEMLRNAAHRIGA